MTTTNLNASEEGQEMKEIMDQLEKRIAKHIKKAKKQKKKAKKTKEERYFEGQKDVLEHVLLDMKILRDQFAPDANEIAALTAEGEPVEAPNALNEVETLLNEALAKEIIIRKTSYYFHECFPTGKAHGKRKALEYLEDEKIATILQQHLTEAANE